MARPVDAGKDQAILKAAEEILFSEGPQCCSMDAVAKRAGVSRATVYARHANRQALLNAVLRTCVQGLSGVLDMAPADQRGVRDALIEFGVRLARFVQSDAYRRFTRAIAGLDCSTEADAALLFQQGPRYALERLASWMAATTAAGLAQFPNPERDAEHLLGMWLGLDIMRAVYGMPPKRGPQELLMHVTEAVDLFLQMHPVRPII